MYYYLEYFLRQLHVIKNRALETTFRIHNRRSYFLISWEEFMYFAKLLVAIRGFIYSNQLH